MIRGIDAGLYQNNYQSDKYEHVKINRFLTCKTHSLQWNACPDSHPNHKMKASKNIQRKEF